MILPRDLCSRIPMPRGPAGAGRALRFRESSVVTSLSKYFRSNKIEQKLNNPAEHNINSWGMIHVGELAVFIMNFRALLPGFSSESRNRPMKPKAPIPLHHFCPMPVRIGLVSSCRRKQLGLGPYDRWMRVFCSYHLYPVY